MLIIDLASSTFRLSAVPAVAAEPFSPSHKTTSETLLCQGGVQYYRVKPENAAMIYRPPSSDISTAGEPKATMSVVGPGNALNFAREEPTTYDIYICYGTWSEGKPDLKVAAVVDLTQEHNSVGQELVEKLGLSKDQPLIRVTWRYPGYKMMYDGCNLEEKPGDHFVLGRIAYRWYIRAKSTKTLY